MGSDQQFCLRWNNFHSNIAASFEHLRDHEEFVDVTLACEGRSLKAHKIVLSACSPYFKNLLKQNPCQHPIIILRDVAFPDLSALLSFVYQGEVYVSQDRLSGFLRTAEMLHIKGLTDQNNQNHHPHSGPAIPVTLGPPTSTTILHAAHDQGILSNKMSSIGGVVPPPCSSPTSPSAHLHHLPLHISPPPKKRRTAATAAAVVAAAAAAAAVPTSSTPPRVEGGSYADPHHPPVGGGPISLEGSTLAAALTKPLPGAVVTSRSSSSSSELIATTPPQQQTAPPPPPPPQQQPPEVPKVKQETEDVKEEELEETATEEDDHHHHHLAPQPPPGATGVEEAVNLVTEGSILRQRIQGFRGGGSPHPHPPHHHTFPPGGQQQQEDSSTDEGYLGGEGGGGGGVDPGGGDGGDQEKEASPMVIRSPLVGLLPRETPGLFGGAGTSGSLAHHESSQEAEFLVRACVPKLWNSRQPGICPICNRVFSNKFNLKQHIINIHTKSEGVECESCHKKCKNKWYLRRHQVTHHGAPLKRNRNFAVEHFVNDENEHGAREKQPE